MTTGTFDLADLEMRPGDLFRWPVSDDVVRVWRVTACLGEVSPGCLRVEAALAEASEASETADRPPARCGCRIRVTGPADLLMSGAAWTAVCTREAGHDGHHMDGDADWTWGPGAGLAAVDDFSTHQARAYRASRKAGTP